MNGKWTLAEGSQKLFSFDEEGEPEIEDLATYGRQLTLDVSLAEVEVDEIDGVKVEPTKGVSVILQAKIPSSLDLEDEGTWMFSRIIYPGDGEALSKLAIRIAKGLGIEPEECIWEDGAQ